MVGSRYVNIGVGECENTSASDCSTAFVLRKLREFLSLCAVH